MSRVIASLVTTSYVSVSHLLCRGHMRYFSRDVAPLLCLACWLWLWLCVFGASESVSLRLPRSYFMFSPLLVAPIGNVLFLF
jgi:hypothetical protein